MSDITVELDTGRVYPLPVPPTTVDTTLITADCRLVGWSLRDTSAPVANQGRGTVTSPAAGAAIVTRSGLAAGVYDVTWSVALEGAAAAADADNFQLKNGASPILTSQNAGAAGVYPQTPARITVPANGTVTVIAVAIGTVGVVYEASIELVPSQIPSSIAEIQDSGNILGEVTLLPGASITNILDHFGMLCQGQIKLHMVSGSLTGVIYARLSR